MTKLGRRRRSIAVAVSTPTTLQVKATDSASRRLDIHISVTQRNTLRLVDLQVLVLVGAAIEAETDLTLLVPVVRNLVAQLTVKVVVHHAISCDIDPDRVPDISGTIVFAVVLDMSVDTSPEIVTPPADASIVTGMTGVALWENRDNAALWIVAVANLLHHDSHISRTPERLLGVDIVVALVGMNDLRAALGENLNLAECKVVTPWHLNLQVRALLVAVDRLDVRGAAECAALRVVNLDTHTIEAASAAVTAVPDFDLSDMSRTADPDLPKRHPTVVHVACPRDAYEPCILGRTVHRASGATTPLMEATPLGKSLPVLAVSRHIDKEGVAAAALARLP